MLRRLISLLAGIGVVGGALGAAFFYWLIVVSPGEDIQQSNIDKILAVESPVYYSGGQDKIGVFFETAHRQYITYDKIPRDFINGIISAEDRNFLVHHGFDAVGVLRAMWANIKAGRVVQGGSTITQQTAKNLFKRKDRSLISKLKELLFALRLEYHYPKEKILEFYANQFYVSGNGRGLGVAARYYFDKDATELDLLECAFIAGSVKRPNYYNPFTKRDVIAKGTARERSRLRVKYVLGQMYKNDLLETEIYEREVGKKIPFRQGKMYFSLNTVMDLIKEAMGMPEITGALMENGIDNIATSGIRIVTSIEKGIQDESFVSLRKELSRLDARLRGYDRDVVQDEYLELTRRNKRDRSVGTFHFGRITSIDDGISPKVWVSLSDNPGAEPEAYVDKRGLTNMVVPWIRYEKNRWSEPTRKDMPKFLDRLVPGDIVYTSVRRVDEDTGDVVLNLEKYPRIQGAALVMRDGMIKAMVGGMENRYYNMAIAAKRPMGSVVKPLIYCAALQLGWNTIDVLNNERDVFIYQKMPYYPRPDHISPHKGVSMSWAGAKSENLATIWLLYHLCDQLSPGRFGEVAGHLGLNRQPDESDVQYRRRVRDELGIVVDDVTYYEVAFERAIAELEPDLIFAGRLMEYETISKFHYGRYFKSFVDNVDLELGLIEIEEEEVEINLDELIGEPEKEPTAEELAAEKKERERKEKESVIRKNILKRSYLRYKRLWDGLQQLRASFDDRGVDGQDEDIEQTKLYRDRVSGSYIYFDKDEVFGKRRLAENMELPGEQEEEDLYPEEGLEPLVEKEIPLDWEVVNRRDLDRIISSSSMEQTPGDFWESLTGDQGKEFWDSVLIDNVLAAGTIELITTALEREYEQLKNFESYSPEILYQARDFKIMVALQYVVGLCRAIGIDSDLDPVLSFPLGSNVMNLMEVARAYETNMSGSIRRYGEPGGSEGLAIIERIENSDGEILYEPTPVEKQVLAPEVTIAISDILRQVVKFGTGRYADRKVRLRSKDPELNRRLVDLGTHVPVTGKTGTANNFTNASFAGGVPGVNENGFFSLSNGYVLTTYVGFDDNEPMVRNTTHISGASGALPLWTKIANRTLLENAYAERVDLVDISFSGQTEFPLYYPDIGQIETEVDPNKGGLASPGEETGAIVTTFGELIGTERVKPTRFFRPYWYMETEGDLE